MNGQDPRNNNYMLDGGNNNDDVIGQRAGTQARTPIEAIQEFQVITNQFDAEFGRTTGAIVNAVTKSGTNIWHGSAFENFQDADLTAKDYFAKKNGSAKPDTQYQRLGGTVGGPIVKDKAHFFFSLERFIIDEGVTINIPTRPNFNTTTTEKTASGTRSSAAITRSTPTTPGACAGCARSRRSTTRSSTTSRWTRRARSSTSTRRWSAR